MATRPAVAATRPALPAMTACSSAKVGLTFDRPASWVPQDDVVQGGLEVSFREPPPARPGVQGALRMSVSPPSLGVVARTDVASPPPPTATVSKILTVDGLPARLTGHRLPDDGGATAAYRGENLTVQWAKGSQSYSLSVVFPSDRRDEFVALAEAICASVRLH